MKYRTIAFVVLIFCAVVRAEPRVMIVSIDGLRPDCALRAEMPHLRSLMKDGSYSFWAVTTPAAVTLPSHTSMFTGVTIERHGILGNDDKAAATEKVLVPTIFQLAHQANLSTGLAAGKSKFSIFAGAIDFAWITPKSVTTDEDVADHAVQIIRDHQPRVMVVHFPNVDSAGHGKGWGGVDQIAAIENADRQLGRVLDQLDQLNLRAQTTIILSADHGGSGKQHGKDDDRSRFIPWLIAGPDVRKNTDLTQFRELTIRTYDTFATACHVLNIQPPADIDGKPIAQAFESTELLNTTAPAK